MLKIIKKNNRILLEYQPDQGESNWVDERLRENGEVLIYHQIFTFRQSHIAELTEDSYDFDSRTFLLGELEGEYYKVDKDILRLKFDLLLDKELPISKKVFLAEGPISIFSKIDQLVQEQIVIGGNSENAIPITDFMKLLQIFPTKTTLTHFANSRISGILKDYLGTITDAQKKLEEHLKRLDTIKAKSKIDVLQQYEVDKYKYIRDSLNEMLKDSESYTENNWQKLIVDFLLLIFPKYVAVLENVHIKDYYSYPEKATDRYIDLTLVDANGNIDIIEIKKPFPSCLLSARKYRDNYTPKTELSGTVMQVEKYLFHLKKWGVDGEEEINRKRGSELPKGMQISITNPKGMIIIGRDNDFAKDQKFDFEIIKRKYANIVDIMTYDDLLQRLENIILKFEKQS